MFQFRHFLRRKRNVAGAQILFEVREFRRAGNGNDKRTLVHQPCQRHLCGRDTPRSAKSIQHLHDTGIGADGIGLEAGQRLAVVVRGIELRVFVDKPAEESPVERTIRNETDT